MKKSIILLTAILITVMSYGQRRSITDSIDVSQITGTDSTYYFSYSKKLFGPGWSVEIEYGTLDDDDATISFGASNNPTEGSSYNAFTFVAPGAFPYTMDATTNDYTNKLGDTVATNIWQMDKMHYRWIACKVAKGSVTSGKVYIYFVQE